jgi:hypothetical protein
MNLAGLVPVLQSVATIASLLVLMFVSWRVWEAKDATIAAKDAQIAGLKDQTYDRIGALLAGMKVAHEAELKLAREHHEEDQVNQQLTVLSVVEIVEQTLALDRWNWANIARSPVNLSRPRPHNFRQPTLFGPEQVHLFGDTDE